MAALSALLRRGATTYALTVREGLTFPALEADASIIGGTGPADARLVRESMGGPVKLVLPILLSESTQAALVAKADAIDAYLRLGECTLEVTFTDSSTATNWTVYHAQPLQPPFTPSMDLAHWVETELTLAVSPFVERAAVALYDAESVTAPCSLDLSAMTGNYRAPLSIECEATGSDTHSLYLALDPTSFDSYLSDAVDLTWDAGATDTEDADARTGDGVYVKSTDPLTAALDTAAYPEGLYLLLARVKALGGETGYVTTDYTDTVVEFTRATWHIVELGYCYLPTRKVRASAAANLTVSVRSSSSADNKEACIDWVYPLPVGDGVFIWHPETDTVDATSIARDPADGTTYVDDAADEQHVTGTSLMALGGNLLIVAEEAAGVEPTQALDVTVSYQPRFAWMR